MTSPSDALWTCTDGGPLVLLPAAALRAWRGSYVAGEDGDFVVATDEGPFAFRTDYDFSAPRTDYERACAGCLGDGVGVVAAGTLAALVFGDEGLNTAFLALEEGGLFATVETQEPWADLPAALASLPEAGPWELTGYTVQGGACFLLDALDLGVQPEREPLPVTLAPGAYAVGIGARAAHGVHFRCVCLLPA